LSGIDGRTFTTSVGEPTGLISEWEPADEVWLVDAVSSGAAPGHGAPDRRRGARAAGNHLPRLDPPPRRARGVEIARALGRLPAQLVVYGIEGADFAAGRGLSRAVAAAADRVVEAVREEVLARAPR
jgi:hydrogenase maturation protease